MTEQQNRNNEIHDSQDNASKLEEGEEAEEEGINKEKTT